MSVFRLPHKSDRTCTGKVWPSSRIYIIPNLAPEQLLSVLLLMLHTFQKSVSWAAWLQSLLCSGFSISFPSLCKQNTSAVQPLHPETLSGFRAQELDVLFHKIPDFHGHGKGAKWAACRCALAAYQLIMRQQGRAQLYPALQPKPGLGTGCFCHAAKGTTRLAQPHKGVQTKPYQTKHQFPRERSCL